MQKAKAATPYGRHRKSPTDQMGRDVAPAAVLAPAVVLVHARLYDL